MLPKYLVLLGLSKLTVTRNLYICDLIPAIATGLICGYPITNNFLDKFKLRILVEVLTERNRAEDIPVTLYIKSLLSEVPFIATRATELQTELTSLLVSQAQAGILNGIVTQLTSGEIYRIVQIVRNNSSDTQTRSNLVLLKLIEINGTAASLPLLMKLLDGLLSQFTSSSRKNLIPATEQCISRIESRQIDYRDRGTLLRSCENDNLLLNASSASTLPHQLLQQSSEQFLPNVSELKCAF